MGVLQPSTNKTDAQLAPEGHFLMAAPGIHSPRSGRVWKQDSKDSQNED